MKKVIFIFTLFLPLIISAQGTKPSAPVVSSSPAATPISSPAASHGPGPNSPPTSEPALPRPSDLLSDIIEDYTYTPEGKRDPFAPYESEQTGGAFGPLFPLQRYDLDQLKLVGIIWDVRQPKAMIMDPTGRGHVVKLNDRLGRNNGYVARIREGEIVIIESFKSLEGRITYQTQVIKLGGE